MVLKVRKLLTFEGKKKIYLILAIGTILLTFFTSSVSGEVNYPEWINKVCYLAPNESCEILFYDAEDSIIFNCSSDPTINIEIFLADQSDHNDNNWGDAWGPYGGGVYMEIYVPDRDNWYVKLKNVDVVNSFLNISYFAKIPPTEKGISSYSFLLISFVSIFFIGFFIKKIKKTTKYFIFNQNS